MNKRLIYAEDAIDAINELHDKPNAWLDLAVDALENLPSAQPEIPEIIRCKDCKYAEVADKEDRQDGYTCQFHRGSIWFSGSYCSWAERRQDADSSGNMSGTQKELKCTETHSCDYQRTETHDSCTDCPLYDHDRHNCPRFNRVIPATIEAAKPRWIPVTEALPEDIRPVIVTWKNNDPKSYYQYIVGKHFIGVAHFKGGKWYWYSSTTEDFLAEYGRYDGEEFDEAIEVVAWCELPEPYEGEQE